MEEAVSAVNRIEMSWKKSYDVFKNITIYTQDVKSLNEDENEYIDFVMPVIYQIANETKKILQNSKEKIDKVYITGMGATINNIDLYFQEAFEGIRCEILKPFFIDSTSLKFPIKEYIEVNSAISLALDGLGFINKELNFSPVSKFDSLDLDEIEEFEVKDWKNLFKDPLNINEKLLVRILAVFLITTIGFSTLGSSVIKRINSQTESIQEKIAQTDTNLNSMKEQLQKIEEQTNVYTTLINNVDSLAETNKGTNNRIIAKDAIPNLLNQIMYIIPQQVQIISIKNTEDKHIVIEAQSEKYEQLEYFSEVIKNDELLKNVKSTAQTNSNVQITIEGDLQ